MSPTQRSLKLLRDEGWTVAITERWNPYAKIRQDLFGFIDLLAVSAVELCAVQATSGSHVSARLAKIKACPAAKLWLQGQNRTIEVHGWRKTGPRGARKVWTCRREVVTADAP